MNPRYLSPKLNNYHYLAILVPWIFFKSRNGRTPYLTQDGAGEGLHWARRAIRASRVRGGRRNGASAGPRRWPRSSPSRHIQMESTELQSTEARAAAFQRCILSLRPQDGQPHGLRCLSVRQQTNGHRVLDQLVGIQWGP